METLLARLAHERWQRRCSMKLPPPDNTNAENR